MRELLITRHGQTEWNVVRRLQGTSNSPLTEKGKRDAKRLGEALASVPIDTVYSSDLLRAQQTARLIIGDRAPVQIEPLLREIHMGAWEGRLLKELERDEPEIYDAFTAGSAEFHPPGGESMREVWDRCVRMREKLMQDEADTILLVTHGKTQGLLLALLQGFAFGGATQVLEGTALSRFTYENGVFHPVVIGDTSHMEEQQ